MPVTFRKRSWGEFIVADVLSVLSNGAIAACFIVLYDHLGLLAYVGIGHPTWGQAALLGFLFAARPRTRADRYVPST